MARLLWRQLHGLLLGEEAGTATGKGENDEQVEEGRSLTSADLICCYCFFVVGVLHTVLSYAGDESVIAQ